MIPVGVNKQTNKQCCFNAFHSNTFASSNQQLMSHDQDKLKKTVGCGVWGETDRLHMAATTNYRQNKYKTQEI